MQYPQPVTIFPKRFSKGRLSRPIVVKKMAEQLLLHGTLEVKIYRIDKLHLRTRFNLCGKGNNEPVGKRIQSQLKRLTVSCSDLLGGHLYATIDLDRSRVARTMMSRHPKWLQSFHIYTAHSISKIVFTIKEGEVVGASLIGRAYLPATEVINGQPIDRWLDILDENKTPIQGGSKLHVRVKFNHVTQDVNWNKGIVLPTFNGVPNAFFNQREGCKVTLYQDAHVLDDYQDITLAGGQALYKHHRCWEEIFDAIWNAKHLIYITGWSVYTDITLIRDPKRPRPEGNIKLGELLKKKAEQNVTVLMLVWDDRTSNETFKRDGLMMTHDQETYDYFKNTKVRCVLCPRNPDNGKSFVQGFQVATMFTHHQKTVVVDGEVEGSSTKRTIVSFLGGIDLCDGRFDTQEHPLFSTLNTLHSNDFHQPNFDGASIKKGGPREPWHDIHCKLDGPVAWDVLYNFEQRWMKQGGGRRHLISMSRLSEITIPPLSIVKSSDNTEAWTVQVFRSIDGGAVEGFPEEPREASSVGLVSGKDNVIDKSIQDAYINAIRRAKHFIYIENQYFIGSSFGWNSKDINLNEINALHLIPKELSLKIVSKIEAGERFCVYVVIPLWPEGKPGSASVQAILDWQKRTMEMMYIDIVLALQKKGVDANPRDYLTFFCLGKREASKVGEYSPLEKPKADSDYARAQESRRFMIYVHSKMMIVDDEYIIIGSANINQRSMDGARDSEIAMGAYQPNHLLSTNQMRPTGQIFSFRISLWLEHLRITTNKFQYPESEECIRMINAKADELWGLYSAQVYPLNQDLPGHLLSYPINISSNGEVTNLAGTELFPDTKAKVLGERSNYIPPIITT